MLPEQLPERLKFKPIHKNDIALAVGKTLNADEKMEFLIRPFIPPDDYRFHFVIQAKRKR